MSKTISLIYFYLVSAAGLALMVIGLFHCVNLIINLTQYDKYPPKNLYDNCSYPMPVPLKGEAPAPIPTQSGPIQSGPAMMGVVQPASGTGLLTPDYYRRQCELRVEAERKQHKLEDIRNSVTFTLVGLVLFLIHFPQARRYS